MVTNVINVRKGAARPGAQGLVSTGGDQSKRAQAKKPRGARSKRDSDVGDALRSIYQKTVHEDVPTEMLDLLDKLG
jgi:hypothetical protein